MKTVIPAVLALISAISFAACAQANDDKNSAAINWFVIQDTAPKPQKSSAPRSFGVGEIMFDVPEAGGHRVRHRMADNSDELLRFKADVRRQVRHFWHPLNEKAEPVIVSFRLLSDGRIADLKLLKSSGTSGFDQAALNAVSRCVPFQYPPKIPTTVAFTFDERMKDGLQSALGAVNVVD